jgi:hypothetical protein
MRRLAELASPSDRACDHMGRTNSTTCKITSESISIVDMWVTIIHKALQMQSCHYADHGTSLILQISLFIN